MGKIELPYVHKFRAKGREYRYYRRAGVRQRVEGEPGTLEYIDNYRRIHASFETGKTEAGVLPGSWRLFAGRISAVQNFGKRSREHRRIIVTTATSCGSNSGTFRYGEFPEPL